jgi:acetyl esterase/lipase
MSIRRRLTELWDYEKYGVPWIEGGRLFFTKNTGLQNQSVLYTTEAVGVMDMLRFHKFTIGWAWVDDYGSSDHPEQFKILYAYSSLHNIKRGTCYPPTLITTADHDDRVVSAHSLKFAAALQAAQSCDNPALIRIETKAGHGAGKPTTKLIDEATDKWAFLVKVLGVKSRPETERAPIRGSPNPAR